MNNIFFNFNFLMFCYIIPIKYIKILNKFDFIFKNLYYYTFYFYKKKKTLILFFLNVSVVCLFLIAKFSLSFFYVELSRVNNLTAKDILQIRGNIFKWHFIDTRVTVRNTEKNRTLYWYWQKNNNKKMIDSLTRSNLETNLFF